MHDKDTIYDAVQTRYATIARTFEPESAATCCTDDTVGCGCYDSDLSALPEGVTGLSLGCGDPMSIANLQPGQRVLDLGSGGGIDCFLAAERVGETGHVIGIDMTPEMITRANVNRERMGAHNVEFRFGRIEALPVESNAIDVIISNCVINLSPDKPAVFSEAYRVLAPGGVLAVSDMVTHGPLEEAKRNSLLSWSECVGGAEEVDVVARMLADAGFEDVSVKDKDAPDVELVGGVWIGEPRLFSARITARKPLDKATTTFGCCANTV